MRSPKQLKRLRRDWPNEITTTVFVVGDSFPSEPQLVEALANHPGCEKIYFIPIDDPRNEKILFTDTVKYTGRMERVHGNEALERMSNRKLPPAALHAYDLTEILKRNGGTPPGAKEIEARLEQFFEEYPKPQEVMSDKGDLLISGHGRFAVDTGLRLRSNIATPNHPVSSVIIDKKVHLPEFAGIAKAAAKRPIDIIPPSKKVHTIEELDAFMRERQYKKVVLKTADDARGEGIFRVFRGKPGGKLMAEYGNKDFVPTPDNPRIFPAAEMFPSGEGLLAMKWLDVTRGDIRAVMVNGECVGAYKRVPQKGNWLANYYQGASIVPLDLKRDLSEEDRQRLNAVGAGLKACAISLASVDLLADFDGKRYLSEINIGPTDDLVELTAHHGGRDAQFDRLPLPDRIAGELLEDYREFAVEREMVRMDMAIAEGAKGVKGGDDKKGGGKGSR